MATHLVPQSKAEAIRAVEHEAATSHQKSLGYNRLTSVMSFRNPNFELVAHIVCWLCQWHDPNAEIPADISTKRHRIAVLKAVAERMQVKMHIKVRFDSFWCKCLTNHLQLVVSSVLLLIHSEQVGSKCQR